MDPADDGRPRPAAGRRRHPDRPPGTDVNFGALTRTALRGLQPDRGVAVHCNQPRRGPQARRRPTGAGKSRVSDAVDRRAPHRPHPVRLRRRRRRRPALLQRSGIPEIARLRRVPGQRPVPAHASPRSSSAAPGQGVRPGRGRRSADVGAAPGSAVMITAIPDVRSLRGLLAQVPKAGSMLDLFAS